MGVGGAFVSGALIGGFAEAAGKVVSQKRKADFPWTVLSAEVRANSFDYLIVTGASFLLWGEPGLPASGFGPFRFAGLIFLRAGILCWIFTAGWILVRAGFFSAGWVLVRDFGAVLDFCSGLLRAGHCADFYAGWILGSGSV
jgi:hypothetical protein